MSHAGQKGGASAWTSSQPFPTRLSVRLRNFLILCSAPLSLLAEDPAVLDVRSLAPGIVVEMRYATSDNFTGRPLYQKDACLLCEPAAKRLARVQKNLEEKGLGLKVWDCYRPLSVQKELWAVVPDDRYVANPKTGSRHNRGASIDLTLVDKNGVELPMPTPFDEFSERAHRSYMDLPANVLKNRATLEEAMTAEGFTGLPTEWWHFDDPEWKNYALRDEPLGAPSLFTEMSAEGPATFRVPDESRQLLVVRSASWNAATGKIQRYERTARGWTAVGEAWDISLGSKGLAWGVGWLPPFADGPRKKEGDNTAPAGLFPIGTAYGYADKAPAGATWPYKPLTDGWVCVDDPQSRRYNQVFKSNGEKDWTSAETMRRSDDLYEWVLNVEHNPSALPGYGSCIFLHVWRRPGGTTEGCTAMPEPRMVELIRWLKPEAKPLLLQLPEPLFSQLKLSPPLP